ncbi:MAG TPA: hypothetical protein VF443_10265 [Nitrospira sp.]
MTKKKIGAAQLRDLIKAEAAKNPLCEDLTKVEVFATESGGGSWTFAFHGIDLTDRAATDAMTAIFKRLSAEYEVAWQTQH